MNIPQATLLMVLTAISLQARGLDCSSPDVVMSTQIAIDKFQAVYGSGGVCDTVTGTLTVSGSDISDLDGLFNLTSVGGLSILNNNILTNIDGLANLTNVVGRLEIDQNPSLASISSLTTLTNIGADLNIRNNHTLININGLSNLTSVGEDLSIENNSVLSDIDGLIKVTSVGGSLVVNSYLDNIFSDSFEFYSNDPIAITSFTVSPGTILAGGNATVSWNTANAISCTPTGGVGGWNTRNIGISGSTVITTSTTGNHTFTLSCDGSEPGDTAMANVVLTVNAEPDPDPNSCDAPALSGSVTNWETFWGESFPGPVYNTIKSNVEKYGYRALKFNTGNVVDSGEIFAVENTATPGLITGAFSECPGDFDVSSGCYSKFRLGGVMTWVTDGSSSGCQLKSNTIYYFNYTYTDGFDATSSRCVTSLCTSTLLHQNF